jgi:hypothetical protein
MVTGHGFLKTILDNIVLYVNGSAVGATASAHSHQPER